MNYLQTLKGIKNVLQEQLKVALDNKTPYYTNVQLEEYISKNKKKR